MHQMSLNAVCVYFLHLLYNKTENIHIQHLQVKMRCKQALVSWGKIYSLLKKTKLWTLQKCNGEMQEDNDPLQPHFN